MTACVGLGRGTHGREAAKERDNTQKHSTPEATETISEKAERSDACLFVVRAL